MNDRETAKELIEKLNAASEAYYGGKPELMSNHEWDIMFDELKDIEDRTGIILPNSPTQNISHENIKGAKVKHEFPALSLQKSKDIEDLLNWAGDKPVNLSWKLDGLTLVVTYDNGKLTRVVTRGDGEVGSDITHLAESIDNIPSEIKHKGHLVIRGEAVISYHDFEEINAKYNNAYENPRNLASGSCNPFGTAESIVDRHLKFIPFTLVHTDNYCNSWSERMNTLKNIYGFDIVDYEFISDPTSLLETAIEEWGKKVDTFDYPVDGLVLTYDDWDYSNSGNVTGHHSVRGGFAFKWQDEEAESILREIEWSVSLNSINPVAIFDEVRLEGTNVTRASLCNISECERLGIGSEGTEVTVIKSNKIIPKVVNAVKHGEFVIPDKCPVCNHDTKILTSAFGIKTLVCTNEDCAAKHINKMMRFVSKFGYAINGLSEKKLIDLINKNLINNCYDILTLPDRESDVYAVLSDSEGWGQKSIDNLINAILKAKTINADKFIYSLCIPTCGKNTSKDIMSVYSIEDVNCLTTSDIFDIIGDVKSENFTAWFSDDKNMELFEKLRDISDVKNLTKNKKSDVLVNKVFVITGSLNNFTSRDALKQCIESNGGKVAGSVSSKTSYLINNDINSKSSKNRKAKELGVSIITEDDFINMIQE